ncbi:MAG TPA: DNA gyrase inhibitor YacG [Gemmataceae bacterium]|nr:DNA gyrase inhibitor YacG [Gemmataceae bacterium]
MIKVSCPVCGKKLQGNDSARGPDHPFCSSRCKLIDLGRWLGEEYAFRPENDAGDPAPVGDEQCIP